jgi:hypothetical protein
MLYFSGKIRDIVFLFLFVCSLGLFGDGAKPLKNKTKLSRININSRLGYISIFVGDRLVVRHSILDRKYQAAVKAGNLDRFFKLPELSLDRDGNYQLPIKIVNFPHLSQIEGTCFEATVREWAIYFSGDLAADAPCLWDIGLFNTAVKKKIFNVSYSNALAKLKINKDGKVKYAGNVDKDINRATFKELQTWLKKYLNIKFELFRFPAKKRGKKYTLPYIVSTNLLLGRGVVVLTKSHAMNAFGSNGENIFISSWGEEYLVKRPPRNAGGRFVEEYLLLIPARDNMGSVMSPIGELVKPDVYNKGFELAPEKSAKEKDESKPKPSPSPKKAEPKKDSPEKNDPKAEVNQEWSLPFGGDFTEWHGDISLTGSNERPFSIALKKNKDKSKAVFSGEFFVWGKGGFVFDFDRKGKKFLALLVYPDKQSLVAYEKGKFTLIKTIKKELDQKSWENFKFEAADDRVRVKLGRKFSVLLKAPWKMQNCCPGIIVDKSSRIRIRKFSN